MARRGPCGATKVTGAHVAAPASRGSVRIQEALKEPARVARPHKRGNVRLTHDRCADVGGPAP